ncbi:2,5-diketo-D-gluconic acid reductase A [Coriobacteriaceae bacterium CHKCI002]|nr:2,5-diketo-D-gluconic acid reductase A [Coriobacteriaceae bacterium CHKCI002]
MDNQGKPQVVLGTYGKSSKFLAKAIRLMAERQYVVHIDAAPRYGNLKEVADAIKRSRVPREQLYVTTKINSTRQRDLGARKSLEDDLLHLSIDYVDAYLIHSSSYSDYIHTWFDMISLKGEMTKAIGVSGFTFDEINGLPCVPPDLVQIPPSSSYCNELDLNMFTQSGIRVEGYSFIRAAIKSLGIKLQKNSNIHKLVVSWCLEKGISPIVGTDHIQRLLECIEVSDTYSCSHESEIEKLLFG